jgi:hypothetical protein
VAFARIPFGCCPFASERLVGPRRSASGGPLRTGYALRHATAAWFEGPPLRLLKSRVNGDSSHPLCGELAFTRLSETSQRKIHIFRLGFGILGVRPPPKEANHGPLARWQLGEPGGR